MPNLIKKGKKQYLEIKDILRRIKHRDFRGYGGIAIRNSSWSLTRIFSNKFGGLIFSIILARLLLPEIFGLYTIAISTLVIFGSLADFGISKALLVYVSKKSDNEQSKAKAYYTLLLKSKIILLLLASSILALSAKWIANNYYYSTDIFLALLVGVIYIPIIGLLDFFEALASSQNNFKKLFTRETIFQGLRLGLVFIFILIFINSNPQTLLVGTLSLITLSYGISLIYLLVYIKKIKFLGLKSKGDLSNPEKKELFHFVLPLGVLVLAGLFNYIDILMLGHYVTSEFIGYYSVAASLIASFSLLLSFSIAGLMPIFSRLNGERLLNAFRKSRRITFLLSIIALILVFLLSKIIITILYGSEYLSAITYLKLFAFLLISSPLILLYESYYISQKRNKLILILSSISILINVILNILLIILGLKYGGMFYAVIGACIATIFSRYFYLASLVFWRRIRGFIYR